MKTCDDCGTVVLPSGSKIRCEEYKKTFHAASKNKDEQVMKEKKKGRKLGSVTLFLM